MQDDAQVFKLQTVSISPGESITAQTVSTYLNLELVLCELRGLFSGIVYY